MLCINTANSLETLTESELETAYDPEGGYLECILPGIISGNNEPEAAVLLLSLELGLKSALESYGGGKKGISIEYQEKYQEKHK